MARPATGIFSFLLLFLLSTSLYAQNVWDTDGDGFDDNNDNCTLIFNPGQQDGDGDFMGNLCDADFTNDNVVNFEDLGVFRVNIFTGDPVTDLNSDGAVNFVDLGIFKSLIFTTPGPTGTDPEQPPCTCYFSGDCPAGTFCNYGPGSFATEDICVWRDVKPAGVVGAGCSIESDLTTGNWTPDICDGVCTASSLGSTIGLESKALVTGNISTWAEAMINPSAQGGGPVDEQLATSAMQTAFEFDGVPLVLGRQTADALALAAGEPFHNYFCHWEGHPEDDNPPVVNLAGNECLVQSAEITIRALTAEIQNPGAAPAIMKEIANVCPNWQNMFGTQCQPGPAALGCATEFIQAQAQFLSTPPAGFGQSETALDKLLQRAQN